MKCIYVRCYNKSYVFKMIGDSRNWLHKCCLPLVSAQTLFQLSFTLGPGSCLCQCKQVKPGAVIKRSPAGYFSLGSVKDWRTPCEIHRTRSRKQQTFLGRAREVSDTCGKGTDAGCTHSPGPSKMSYINKYKYLKLDVLSEVLI